MSSDRHAALALHGLADVDRDWLLERLEPAQRDTLQVSLQELDRLGVPSDPRLVREALDRRAPAWDPARPRARLAAIAPQTAFALLAGERPGLIAMVLAAQDWSWREDFLALLPVACRDAVVARLHDGDSGANQLVDWLLREMAARVEPLEDLAPRPSSPLQRASARLVRLFGSRA